MKLPRLLPVLLALTFAAPSVRPATLPRDLVSPEVHPDGRATFRIHAPRAESVALAGDWMDPATPLPLTRDADGIWSVTTGPLESGPAIYAFRVDDLVIADPVNPAVKLRTRTSASLVDIPGSGSEPWEPADVPRGTVEIIRAPSQVCGDTRSYRVYTPPGYSRTRGPRLPVLYLLHGHNDTAAGWTDVGRADMILDRMIATGRAKPMVAVMPWGHAAPFTAPGATNTALMERYLLDEVIPQVEARYRVARGREQRAIVGLSMGGGHALTIGLRHLDRFSAVAAFSTAIPPEFETRFADLWNPAHRTNARLGLLWIGCGRQDGAFDRNASLARLLDDHGVRNTFVAMDGRHNYAVWRRCLAEVLPQLFR